MGARLAVQIMSVVLPRRVAEELKRRGVDAEAHVVDFLVGLLKFYRAAEEAVKALATYFDLRDILEGVERSGRWSAGKLGKAVFEDFRGGGIERMVSEARRIVEKK